jgi:hypothetical protein
MNHLQKHLSASLIALAALTAAPIAAWAATAPSLGTAASFAVLSVGTAVPPSTDADVTAAVTTSYSTITGDVGSAGAVSLTGSTINGNVLLNGALVPVGSTYSGTGPLPVQVINDFNTAYGNYAAIPCTTTFAEDAPGGGNTYTNNVPALGPLAPGVYCFHTAATFTDTTLTLSGPSNGVWIFKVGIDGTGALTGTNFSVVMANGGDSCNVSWWVAQAATMTKNPAAAAGSGFFQGDILAGAADPVTGNAITMTGVAGAPSSFNGDALANGPVTLTDVNVTGCNASGGGNGGNGGHCGKGNHYGHDKDHEKCNQGVGNGHEGCDPGHSTDKNPWGSSNDEDGGERGHPGRNHHDNNHSNKDHGRDNNHGGKW